MRDRALLLCLAMMVFAGCECGAPAGDDAGRDTPAPTDTPMGMSDVPSSDVPGDAPRDTPSAATVVLSDFAAFGNCMPIVPSDPIVATWTITVSGASSTSARFVTGTLSFTTGETQTITVETDTIPLTAGGGTGDQRRASGTPTVPGCAGVCGAGVTLNATYEVDGAMFVVTGAGNYTCAL